MDRKPGSALFAVAAVLGLLHAAPSAYWATGGTWLLDTVGQFAVDLQRGGDPMVPVMLGVITALKVAGAVVPWLDHRSPPPHRWVRVVSWLGALVLVVWGGFGMVGGWVALLTGAVGPAQLGHALLWDPLFLAWGVVLAGALRRTAGTATRRRV